MKSKTFLLSAILCVAVGFFLSGCNYKLINKAEENDTSEISGSLKEENHKLQEELENQKNEIKEQERTISELKSQQETLNQSLEKESSDQNSISQLEQNLNKEKICNQAQILYNTIPPKDDDECGRAFAENIEEMYKAMKDAYEHTPKKCEENYYKKVKKAYEEYLAQQDKCNNL